MKLVYGTELRTVVVQDSGLAAGKSGGLRSVREAAVTDRSGISRVLLNHWLHRLGPAAAREAQRALAEDWLRRDREGGGGGRSDAAISAGSGTYQSRCSSDSGRLFFDSPDALVPQDTNGLEDVYEFEPVGVGSCTRTSSSFAVTEDGCVGLVPFGVVSGESEFLDASSV